MSFSLNYFLKIGSNYNIIDIRFFSSLRFMSENHCKVGLF